jgi:hypothetical protein
MEVRMKVVVGGVGGERKRRIVAVWVGEFHSL